VTLAMLAADVPVLPISATVPYGGTVLPASGQFAWADGSLIDRTTYAAFFSAVGHAYNGGVDPGSNLVRVPDLRGRVPVGVDGVAGRLAALDALGQSGGAETHALTTPQLPIHDHKVSMLGRTDGAAGAHSHSFPLSGGVKVQPQFAPAASDYTSLPASGGWPDPRTIIEGGGQAHNNMQPFQVVNYLVRVL
jgi:microcystin-dependent protein